MTPRPLGVTILAVLSLIGGLLSALASVRLLGDGGPVTALGARGVGAVLALAFAYGAWRQRSWAWTLGMIIQIAWVASSVLGLLGGKAVGAQLMYLATSAIILMYLSSDEVRSAFGR